MKIDKRPKRGSWAPGNYMIAKCVRCEKEFMGDKRAHVCADCAYKDPIYCVNCKHFHSFQDKIDKVSYCVKHAPKSTDYTLNKTVFDISKARDCYKINIGGKCQDYEELSPF